jgi:hypothetical protein
MDETKLIRYFMLSSSFPFHTSEGMHRRCEENSDGRSSYRPKRSRFAPPLSQLSQTQIM